MKREILLVVVISCAVAQLMLRPIKVITVENLLDLKARLKKAGDKLVVIGFLPKAWQHSENTERIEKLALQYANFVVFLRVYEYHDDIFNEYNVTSVPTFIFVRQSEPLSRRTRNTNNIACVIDSVKAEDQQHETLRLYNTSRVLDEGGLLYDVKCHDDMEWWLTEARDRLVVLAFLPSDSAHGYLMTSAVQELAKKNAKTTLFLRIKEEHDDLYKSFGIQIVPTFMFIKNKKKLFVHPGTGIKQLTATLEAVLTANQQAPLSHIIDITSPQDLEQRLSSAGNKLVILAFMTKWCSKCRKVISKVEDMADEYYGSVVFLKIDDDSVTNELYTKYKIKRVPTFVFLRNSKKINPFSGTSDERIRTHVELQDFKIFLYLCSLTKEYFGVCLF